MFYYFRCRLQTTSCKSNSNLHWRRGERNDREIHGGCDLNSSWFSMILKNLSRNSKVALKAHWTLCVIAFCVFISVLFVFVYSVRCKCRFLSYSVRVWWGYCLALSFCRYPNICSNWFQLCYVRFMCGVLLRSAPSKRHSNVTARGGRTIDYFIDLETMLQYLVADWDKR